MENNESIEPLDLGFSEEKANELMAQSDAIINAALAGCDLQSFAPVALTMPQMIKNDSMQKVTPPNVESFFENAEAAWNSLLETPSVDGLNSVDTNDISTLFGETHSSPPE